MTIFYAYCIKAIPLPIHPQNSFDSLENTTFRLSFLIEGTSKYQAKRVNCNALLSQSDELSKSTTITLNWCAKYVESLQQ